MRGYIVWPANKSDAVGLYLRYLMQVLDEAGIYFVEGPNDPLDLGRRYLEGRVSLKDMSLAAEEWWKLIYERQALSNFSDRNILMARLALSLLSPEAKDDFSEAVSWFLQLIGKLGGDTKSALRLMDDYFVFSKP